MTPAEHYAEAERLLAEAAKVQEEFNGVRVTNAWGLEALIGRAQVHATLATLYAKEV